MTKYKEDFIRFMSECGVLMFGEFTLKSGRKSPYFLNAGNYCTGAELLKLGEFYADCIMENVPEFDTLFGPAYKGIPLCVSAAIALNAKYGKTVNYSFNRIEEKKHGEGGVFVGKQPADKERIVIIDDVTTSGKALRGVLPLLNAAANVEVAAMVITVDRMEKALDSDISTVRQIYSDFGINVFSVVNINDIIEAVENGVIDGKDFIPAMREYRETYGVKA
ncbi:MAG: orotate phosphoribosyltransferase [Oscillospiraceae bacterium]|jgi:orotate phosphoribosyltransferase|nr:orotate phosphoribosyltransferase [Oscillospiraceae bacterium]